MANKFLFTRWAK